jgi:hypothetical protein
MDSTFPHRALTFRLAGQFTLPEDELIAVTKIVTDAFIDCGALAKLRVPRLLIARWCNNYAQADQDLVGGWQRIWCNPNGVYQILYQLSHELGHVAAGHHKRFSKGDKNQWVEEIVCGVCSMHAAQYAADNWKLAYPTKEHFSGYLDDLKVKEFPDHIVRFKPIPVAEFEAAVRKEGFSENMRPYAGRLYSMVGGRTVMADLPGLAEVPPGLHSDEYLRTWKSHCNGGGQTPLGFERMIAT